MLKVKTYLDRSDLHGIGVFAAEDIPQDTLIWVFNPLVDLTYSPGEWRRMRETLHPASFSEIEKYSYKENNLYYLCTDNAQFMNHSSRCHNVTNDSHDNTMHAMREIRQGEELLCSYLEFCDKDDRNIRIIQQSGIL